jgi:hypothetical protein
MVNLFLSDPSLAKLGCDDSLRDLLMVMARCCPSDCKLLIIDEASLLQPEDSRLSNLIFNAPGLEMSEKLALTLRTCNERIERNRMSYFVRV